MSLTGWRLQNLVATAGVICVVGFSTTSASAIVPVPNDNDPGPCAVTIYWDETWAGCEEVDPDSNRGKLLAAAGENAIRVMRAWRRRNPDLIVGSVSESSAVERAAGSRRRAYAELLRREMGRTFMVDSMSAQIASDSVGSSSATLRSRYWLARSVREGRSSIAKEVGCVDYVEEWTHVGERWVLRGIVEPTPGPVPGFVIVEAFPRRDGRNVTGAANGATTIEGEQRPAGAGRLARSPEPLTMVPPNYPVFAREAQIQGKVVLHVLVTGEGRVAHVKVLVGVTGLNEAAMDAVRRWTFKPALDTQGNPVAAWEEVPIDFHF